ncbi:MAG: flavodoxin family protein [Caldisericia bacterium]
MKKILVLNGSPKGKGNTFEFSKKVEQVLDELKPSGFEFEYFFLKEKNLSLCKGCFTCLTKGEHLCPLSDDTVFTELRAKMHNADGIIFACPTYTMNISWMMKNFMDRFAFMGHRPEYFDKPSLLVSTTGGVGLKECFDALNYVSAMGFHVVDKLGTTTVPIKNWDNLDEKTNLSVFSASKKFFDKIYSHKPYRATTGGILQYQAFKAIYSGKPDSKKEFPADFSYWEQKGWLDPKRLYYTDGKLSFFQALISKSFGSLMRKMVKKM